MLDPRLLEVPHDYALLAQTGSDGCRIALRVARENEVRRRRQHLKTQALHGVHHCFTTFDDLLTGLLEIRAILERCSGTRNGNAIQRVRVEAVLDSLQGLNQVWVTNREPYAKPGQRARLRQRLRHQQIRITIDQSNG